ncbi:MAG: ABC transporter permease subunit [Pseudomonadota bacterium]
MTEASTLSAETTLTDDAVLDQPAVKGRSLLDTAILRLKRNRAAMVSLWVVIGMVFAALLGPTLSPHDYDEVYNNFVGVKPSLTAYPKTDQITPITEKALARARVDMEAIDISDDQVSVSIVNRTDDALDPRITRYMVRTDIYENVVLDISPADPTKGLMRADIKPLRFVMGTDQNGRDLLTRIFVSLRISLMVGALATGVALLIGVTYGATSGFIGGHIDNLMMRFVDLLYSLPFVFFVILLVVFFGNNIVLIFIAVGCIQWLDMARIVRGQTLQLKQQEFVQASQALGVGRSDIIKRHIIPNLAGTVAVYMTLLIPRVILLESFLSFLGLGVQEPLTSLGVLIAEGARYMRNDPYLLIFPALTMSILLFALNFLGDGLRDALDPKDR